MTTVNKILLGVALLSLTHGLAHAERKNPLEGQPAVRHRYELRRLRFEITPMFTTSINQDYKHAFGVGGSLTFHITDWLAIGFEGSYLFNADTALEDAVRARLATNDASPNKVPGVPSLQQHDQRVLGINATMSPYAQVTPFFGKFAVFSALFVSYDLYVKGGLGLVNYVQNGCCSSGAPGIDMGQPGDSTIFAGLKVGAMIGVGAHVFFNEWLGMELELRDYIVGANPGGLDVNADRKLTKDDEGVQNNIFFGVGLTLMLPPHARITR
jgi:outer membrane beta-barrel protein